MTEPIKIDNIKNRILTIRNKQVMLDKDLAEFYQIETKQLNKAVKRNIERFPQEFMFQLTQEEYENLRCQIGTSKIDIKSKSQPITSNWGGRRYLPFVFTEQGVSMLSSVLNSKIAIQVSIQIINSFVSMRKFILENNNLIKEITLIKKEHKNFELETNNNFNKIFAQLENLNPKPNKGVFFEGQLFDSHKFISDLIRDANKEIKLIDNYIDDRTLNLFNKRKEGVKVIIYTKNMTSDLKQDLKKYNSQYEPIQIKEFSHSHDRFLIIDNQVYHIGASLKDLGKKWFGFSKMENESLEIIRRLE